LSGFSAFLFQARQILFCIAYLPALDPNRSAESKSVIANFYWLHGDRVVAFYTLLAAVGCPGAFGARPAGAGP
jgi:hypothetical protein